MTVLPNAPHPSHCLNHLLPISHTSSIASVTTTLDGRFRLPQFITERVEISFVMYCIKTFPYIISRCFACNVFTIGLNSFVLYLFYSALGLQINEFYLFIFISDECTTEWNAWQFNINHVKSLKIKFNTMQCCHYGMAKGWKHYIRQNAGLNHRDIENLAWLHERFWCMRQGHNMVWAVNFKVLLIYLVYSTRAHWIINVNNKSGLVLVAFHHVFTLTWWKA